MDGNESLYDYFARYNGEHSDAEKIALNTFQTLMQNPFWRPSNPYFGGFRMPIQIGILAQILHKSIASKAKLSQAVASIIDFNEPDPTLISELHAGALLTQLAGSVEFLTAGRAHGLKTPDLKCKWGDAFVDVEVARADRRHLHEQHLKTQQTLVEAIGVPPNGCFAIFVAVDLTQKVLDDIVTAVIQGKPGEQRGVVDCWAVTVGDLAEGDRYVGGEGFGSLAPDWWRKLGGPSFFVIMRQIGGATTPVVNVVTKVPVAAYLNPIRRKADAPQRTGDFPYIIALDTSELPGADGRIRTEFETFYSQWPHVSAVLLYQPIFPVAPKRWWRAHLIRNPVAQKPLVGDWFESIDFETADVPTGF
jgi:hypothetical protein